MPSIPTSKSGRSALSVATEAVTEAGALLRARSQGDKQVTQKGRGNVVTDVDHASEELIIGRLLKEFPDFGILAEESGRHSSSSEYSWIIDPLDGTKNYAAGVPYYCVTLALARGSDVLVGVTFDPNRQELFRAERGGGAYLNDARLQVSARTTLQAALAGTDMGYDDTLGHYALKMWDAVWPGVQGMRIMGSSALGLAYTAAGRMDIYVHHSLYPWDIAAAVLMVQESGGLVTNRNGAPIDIQRDTSVIAANPAIVQDFLKRTEGLDWRNPPGR